MIYLKHFILQIMIIDSINQTFYYNTTNIQKLHNYLPKNHLIGI